MWNRLVIGLVAAGCGTGAALGCGPFFPSDIVLRSDEQMTAAPVGDFAAELARIKPREHGGWKAVRRELKKDEVEDTDVQKKETDEGDMRDLLAAMKERGLDARAAEKQMGKLRGNKGWYELVYAKWLERGKVPAAEAGGEPAEWVSALPAEFGLYERGAMAYHADKLEAARSEWSAVLALGEKERKYRSVWATYMIGRSYDESDAGKAVEWFEEARKMARAGYVDTLGLATASLGWEAKAEMTRGGWERAIELYLQQMEAGEPGVAVSLRICVENIMAQGEAVQARVAKDETAQRVVTAWLLSRPRDAGAETTRKWIAAVEAAGKEDVAGADRLAWAAYQAGDVKAAERWLKRAEKESGVAYWVRAKLALRAGDKGGAMELLAKAASAFPAKETWPATTAERDADPPYRPREQVQGELGVLKLSRGEFSGALVSLMQSGYWQDAAYVAERVLTADELIACVDKNWAKEDGARVTPREPWEERGVSGMRSIRYLLARRLLRDGRWKEALPYFDVKLRARAQAYVEAIRAGHDAKRGAAERAKNLWEAAKIARNEGIDLLGTELDPDFAIWGGNFETRWFATERTGPVKKEAPNLPEQKINVATAEERKRVEEQKPPEKRFHYRYVAAEHAWAAALLMPDGSAETAEVLCAGGGWIKRRDPKMAEKFYKALVARCGKTELGKAAAATHWFPVRAEDK